jgi:hypothetical protein
MRICLSQSASLLTLYVVHQVISWLPTEDYQGRSSQNTTDTIGLEH